jgi:hypothetical protein
MKGFVTCPYYGGKHGSYQGYKIIYCNQHKNEQSLADNAMRCTNCRRAGGPRVKRTSGMTHHPVTRDLNVGGEICQGLGDRIKPIYRQRVLGRKVDKI